MGFVYNPQFSSLDRNKRFWDVINPIAIMPVMENTAESLRKPSRGVRKCSRWRVISYFRIC